MEKIQKIDLEEKNHIEEKIISYISNEEEKINDLESQKINDETLKKDIKSDINKDIFKKIKTLDELNKINLEEEENLKIDPKIQINFNNNINMNINNINKNTFDNKIINNNSSHTSIPPINLNEIFNPFTRQNQNPNFIRKDNYNKFFSNYNNNSAIQLNIYNNQIDIDDIKEKISFNKKQIDSIIWKIEIIFSLLSSFKGSLYLQKILLYLDNNEISILFSTINQYINKIMCLEYGNYFIQKFIKKLNPHQRLIIYQIIEKDFLIIATNRSGTHSIQALIDSIQTPLEQMYFDKLLNKDILSIINNENGYHIIMKLILEKTENQRNNINLFLVSNIEKIAIDPYGSYCVSKFIINNNNLNLRYILIKNLENNLKNLIFNKNSCSVLMLAIKKFGINNFEFIIKEIENNLEFLSLYPISVSFVFKIIYFLKENQYYKLNAIIRKIYRNDSLIKSLMTHKNGNKLIKKLMEFSNNSQKKYIKTKLNFFQKK